MRQGRAGGFGKRHEAFFATHERPQVSRSTVCIARSFAQFEMPLSVE